MTKHKRAGEHLNSRVSLKQRYTIETKQSNKKTLCWRATELSLRVGAQSEDTELIMGALSWAWWPLQIYSFLLSGNSAPTDVFTQPLLPVIKELSAWVCVETIVGLPQRHMCRGCDWEVVLNLWIWSAKVRKSLMMPSSKTRQFGQQPCLLSNFKLR